MADTYGPVEATAKKLYLDNVQLALQQKESRFSPCFSYISGVAGKETQVVELIGTSQAIRNLPHTAPTPHIPPKHIGISVRPQSSSWGRTVDRHVKIMNVTDYNSAYVQEGAAAMMRDRDDILYSAIFGPRLIANTEDGTVASTAWAGSTIAVNETGQGATGGNTGLVPGKLLKGIELLINSEAYAEGDQICVGVAGQDNTVMMLQEVLTSADYRSFRGSFDKAVLQAALGLTFVRYPSKLTVNGASGYRELPMWLKSGMHWGEPSGLETDIDKDPALQFQLRVFMQAWTVAIRSEDEKVIKILAV